MTLGEKLRNLRLKDKKTLQEQSMIIGVSMNSIYRWEHDLAIPRRTILKIIAEYYAVSMDWMISENTSASLVSDVEIKLLNMFRKLSDHSRYKVLGYVERICVEDYTESSSNYVAEKMSLRIE
jgi:transcriptional regulator with XRE-family HTH domain